MAQEGILGGLDNSSDAFNSRFEGRWSEQQARLMLACLVSMVTFGIGAFWASMWYLRWIYSKSVINGKRLEFRATGMSFFKKWIIWFLLTLVTLGIYGIFFVPRRFQEFLAANLFIEGETESFTYNGGVIESIIVFFTIFFMCLFFAPLLLFAVYPAYSINGRKVAFKAGAGATLIRIVCWMFMLCIPFYFLALPVSVNKFALLNTTLENE
ncbi:MAG: YjgN family protein [Treponema sp.]|nr:YjgN family protein [Treponema sp.]